MKTINLILLTFLLTTLASCMPDSLTSFEEKEVERDTSGGSSEVVDTDTSDGTLTGISISQVQGDTLFLRVDSIENFNVGDNINVSSLAATSLGVDNVASIIAITQQEDGDLFLTVTLNVAAAIPGSYFSVDHFVDNCSTGYSNCGSASVGAGKIDFVGFVIRPAASFSKSLNSIVSNTAMDITYVIDPPFPNAIQLDLNTIGDNSDDAIESPVGPFRIDTTPGTGNLYTVTASVTNFGDSLDSTETAEVSFFLTGSIPGTNVDESSSTNLNGTMLPTGASMARYQFLRLDGNQNRFYRGSRISVNTIDNTSVVVGRVLLTDDDNGILVEATGDIKPGHGIDNTAKFYSNETVVKDYQFWYVEDSTSFGIGDTITTSGGDTASVVDVTGYSNRLYVEVLNGDFEVGELISEDTSATTTLLSVEDRLYVNGILEVASVAGFTVGGSITTSTAGDKALVVAIDSTDDLLYIMHLSGSFTDGEGIDNADTYVGNQTTITAVVGPIVKIGTGGGPALSSTESFREGSLVSSASTGPTVQRATGLAVSGTDISANELVVQVEHFDNDTWFDIGQRIDDYTDTNDAFGTPYLVASNETSQLVIGYVDESIHIEPFVLGSFSNAILAPEELPNGLTFDGSTGIISGTPTEATTELNYTVSFSYPGETSASYTFSLVVYNQFEITQVTDNASSYLMHKEGRGLAGAKCKILGPQIIDDPLDTLYGSSVYGLNDIVCRLEAGEQDLYAEGIDLKIKSGGGMCEFVRYKPFSYQAINTASTNATYVKYADFDVSLCAGGNADASIGEAVDHITVADMLAGDQPLANTRSFGKAYCVSGDCIVDDANAEARYENGDGFCAADHSLYQNGSRSYPNTDTGSYDLITVNCELVDEDNAECACNAVRTKVQCGGTASSRIGGPIRDTSINPGVENSLLYSSFNSLEQTLELGAPITDSAYGNYRLANYTRNNSCYTGDNNFHIERSEVNGGSSFSNTWEGFDNSNDAFGGTILNQFYTFECLNATGDVKARIRMQVRDWDRTFVPENDTEIESHSPASIMDDTTTDCFGSNCNNRNDFDNIIGTPFGTCAETQALTNPVGGSDIAVDLNAGSHSITINGGSADTFNANDFRRGTIIYVGPVGELTFTVEEYVGPNEIIVTRPSPQSILNADVQFYDGYRFPLEGF